MHVHRNNIKTKLTQTKNKSNTKQNKITKTTTTKERKKENNPREK